MTPKEQQQGRKKELNALAGPENPKTSAPGDVRRGFSVSQITGLKCQLVLQGSQAKANCRVELE
jgi:nucleoside diphosphate kinase